MTLLQINATGRLGIQSGGLTSGLIPPGALMYSRAQAYPGEEVRMRVLFQNGHVRFREDGSYEEPPGPVVVLWDFIVGSSVAEGSIQSLIGPQPPIVSTGRKAYMSAGV